jgi:hypothetical protein
MENFKLVSEFLSVATRSFELADSDLLNPNSALPLVMGEFLEVDADYKMARGAATPALGPSVAYFQFQGAYDTQALGKGPFLYQHEYEVDTKIFEEPGGAYDPFVLNGAVLVGTIAGGVHTGRRGVLPQKTTPVAGEYILGYVTRLPANNNGFLRFRRIG